LDVVVPELRNFEISYYDPRFGDESWINRMLASATKLEFFSSYKLNASKLSFASNALTHAVLYSIEPKCSSRSHSGPQL